MNRKTDPNEPAFPSLNAPEYSGITKRELFAAMALQGMFADSTWEALDEAELSSVAIEYADALIKELNTETK